MSMRATPRYFLTTLGHFQQLFIPAQKHPRGHLGVQASFAHVASGAKRCALSAFAPICSARPLLASKAIKTRFLKGAD